MLQLIKPLGFLWFRGQVVRGHAMTTTLSINEQSHYNWSRFTAQQKREALELCLQDCHSCNVAAERATLRFQTSITRSR
jgi:hypothetical protein